MYKTVPEVYVLAATMIDGGEMDRYLKDIGAVDPVTKVPWEPKGYGSQAEKLIEFSGRMCYRSWFPGMNQNVTKIREGNHEYIGNIVKQKHGSVLEHANVTMLFHNVSRVFTHELVRHRAGMAYSQESLRYVRLTNLGMWIPKKIGGKHLPEQMVRDIELLVEKMEAFQFHWGSWLDDEVGREKKGFAFKKAWTSFFRRFAPIGLSTGIIATGNLRAWRHQIAMRTSTGAEVEMRYVYMLVAHILKERYPAVFQDMRLMQRGKVIDDHSISDFLDYDDLEYVFENEKV